MKAAVLAFALWALGVPVVAADVFRWEVDDPRFGGWSGLWMAPDGLSFKVVSDRGRFAEATLTRDDGQITGVALTRLGDIAEREGKMAPGGFLQDAEGLTITSDGGIYVSFEGHHRVRRFGDFDQVPGALHDVGFFDDLQTNSGFEALASDADGAIYAIPERSGRWTLPFPVWRYQDGVWDNALSLTRTERFLVSDAAFGPDGHLYVLEREFVWILGFRSRIRRFVLSDTGFDGGEEVWRSRWGAFDNLEGIAVRRDETGRMRATMISDDNFHPLQATYLVEIAVPERTAASRQGGLRYSPRARPRG